MSPFSDPSPASTATRDMPVDNLLQEKARASQGGEGGPEPHGEEEGLMQRDEEDGELLVEASASAGLKEELARVLRLEPFGRSLDASEGSSTSSAALLPRVAPSEVEEGNAAAWGGDCEGFTPLMEAVCCGYMEAAQYLLSRRRPGSGLQLVNQATSSGQTTALMLAAEMGCLDMVAILLQHGADAALANCSGWNALMLASLHGHAGVVRALLQHGGQDVDAQDHLGETALYKACCAGSLEVAEALLLRGGANPWVPVYAECRWTALQMAQREGHQAVSHLIQWWEQERVERAYHLHKARYVSEARLMRRLFPEAPPPGPLLKAREEAGLPPPVMMLDDEGGAAGVSAQGEDETGEECEEEEAEEEEERRCVLGWVVHHMAGELYVELTHGLRLTAPL